MPKLKLVLFIVFFFALSATSVSTLSAAEPIRGLVPLAEKVGQGRLTYLFWEIYDATLYAPQGIWRRDKPFALQLSYLRELEGRKIADRTIEEIRNQGLVDEIKLATWHAQLRNIFPDIKKGTSLTGVFIDSGETLFYLGEKEIGRISDPQFSQVFFDIWLGENTSAPDLRQKLLGAL